MRVTIERWIDRQAGREGGLPQDVLDDLGDVSSGDPLSQPGALHLQAAADHTAYVSEQTDKNTTAQPTRLAWEVGMAHTLKLYGLIKIFAMPSPITRIIHSSKLAGGLNDSNNMRTIQRMLPVVCYYFVASALDTFASIKPLMHDI